jgi:hypothetical protein
VPRTKRAYRAGEYEDVSARGLVGPSSFPKRSRAEIRTLQQVLGVANPTPGVEIRPSAHAELAELFDRARSWSSRPEPMPSGGGWGAPVYYRPKYVGKGGDRRLKSYWVLPAGVAAVVLGGLLVVYALDRVFTSMANWWPGSLLGVSDWSNFQQPQPLFTWMAQHFNVSSITGAVQSLTAPSPPPPTPQSSSAAQGTIFSWGGFDWSWNPTSNGAGYFSVIGPAI